MAIGDPPAKRKAHVKRIWKVNDDDGSLDENVWMDVLRFEKMPADFRTNDKGQTFTTVFNFHWNDDANNPDNQSATDDPQQENANPSRKTRKLSIKNSGETSTLWIVDKARITMPQGAPLGAAGQAVNFVFDNSNMYSITNADPPYKERTDKSTRKTTVVKIVNNDLGGMEMKADGDDTKSNIVDWDTYKQALIDGVKDDSQYINFDVTDSFKISFAADALTGAQGQIIRYTLTGNEELEPDKKGSLDPPLFDAGNSDAADVIRTDPLQVIVNISPVEEFIIACGGPRNSTGNTMAWISVTKDKNDPTNRIPDIAFEKKPFTDPLVRDGSQPFALDLASVTPAAIGGTADNFVTFDYQGNIGVSVDPNYKNDLDTLPKDVYYDKKGKQIFPTEEIKPPNDNSQFDFNLGRAVFSDGSGTVYMTYGTTIKLYNDGKTILWRKDYPNPGSTPEAVTIDKDTGYIVIGSIALRSIVTMDPADGSIVSNKDIAEPSYEQSGGFGLAETFTETFRDLVDFASDCSYVVHEKTNIRVSDLTLVPYADPDRGTFPHGTVTLTGTEKLIKYDRNSKNIWETSTTMPTSVRTWGVILIGGDGGAEEIGQYFGENYYDQTTGEGVKVYSSAKCIGDYVVQAYHRDGWFPETFTEGDLYPNTFYISVELDYYIDIFDKSGKVINTIDWGSVAGTKAGSNFDMTNLTNNNLTDPPSPVTQVDPAKGGAVYWDGFVNLSRKPRFPFSWDYS